MIATIQIFEDISDFKICTNIPISTEHAALHVSWLRKCVPVDVIKNGADSLGTYTATNKSYYPKAVKYADIDREQFQSLV